MKISRRDFIHAGCVAGAVALAPSPLDKAKAAIHGSAAGNPSRVTINVNPSNNAAAFSNMAKAFSLNIPFANAPNSKGYPTAVTISDIISNPQFLIGYYGDYIQKWSGQCSIDIPKACLVRLTQLNGVTTGGIVGGVSGSSGDTSSLTITNQTNPRVQFTPGAVIQGISQGASNGLGGNYIRVTFRTNFVNKFSGLGSAAFQIIKIQNSTQSGVGNVSVAGAIDTWNYVQVDSSHIDLTTSVTTGAVSAWTTNGVAGGEGITTPNNMNVNILGSGNGASSYSGFDNYVFCTTANEINVTNGQYWGSTFVSDLQYMMNHASAPMSQRGWLRFMDYSQVQGSWEADFTNRRPANYISWSAGSMATYTTTSSNAAITNTSDAFTCSDATTSVWSGSAYIDSAVIQGTIASANSTGNPTLNVGGHGAKPIFGQQGDPLFMPFTAAAASGGLAIQLTFNASWLNGGSTYTFNYTTSAGATMTVSSSGSTAIAITVLTGTLAANQLIIFADNTAAFIVSQSSGPAGGSGNYVLERNTTQSGSAQVLNDTATAQASAIGLATAINASLVLPPAKFLCGIAGNSIVCNFRTAQAGALTVTYTSGPAIFTVARMTIGAISTGQAFFVYNAVAGGWLYLGSSGVTVASPIEAAVQLCNLVGAHMWWNWPVYTQSAYVTALTQFVADGTTGLTSGLRFGTEVGNEVWRIGGNLLPVTQNLGFGLGFANGSNNPGFSWVAMRTIQCATLSKSAWTGKGRNLSDHYIIQQAWAADFGVNGNFDTYGLKGTSLTTLNTIYASYGGFGGTSVGDHSTSPNRPCDIINASGFADYWFSDYLREQTSEIFGSVSDNSVWLQASLDYTNGNTSAAFSALANMFSTQRGSATISSGSYNSGTGVLTLTLAAPINQGTAVPGDIVHLYNLTGTGAFAFLANSGNGWDATSLTSGTTIGLNVGAGRSAFTVTGGMAVDETASTVNPSQASNFAIFAQLYWPSFESVLAQYDNSSGRSTNGVNPKIANLHYEGAPQWSVASNAINGTNSTSETGDLIARMGPGGLNWNVNAYDALGGTGATAVAHVAQQVLNMIQGWKHDTDKTGAAANTGSYKNMIKAKNYAALVASAGSGREVKPAQYGIDVTTWGMFQELFTQANPYSNYDAVHEFNA
jgi:hypothetical protein